MVSGFFTSPWDHSRIFSGDASEIRIALNESGSFGFSKKLKMSFTSWVSLMGYASRLRRRRLRGYFACHLFQRRLVLARRRWILDQLHVEAERLQLLEEHVERLGQTRLENVLAFDDGLVHARAAHHVVRLDGQELLQAVGSAIGLHRPDLHLAQTLAAELSLAAQRL